MVLHARNQRRGKEALSAAPGAETVVIGDLSSIAQMHSVADQVNQLGEFNAVIHNAAVGYREAQRIETEAGLPHVFAVNTLAPYLLTAVLKRRKRLVYFGLGLRLNGDPRLNDLNWKNRSGRQCRRTRDTKLHDVLLAFAIARRCPDVFSNALEPGWVATGWEVPERRTIWMLATERRFGWRSAMIRPPRFRAITFTI